MYMNDIPMYMHLLTLVNEIQNQTSLGTTS